MIEKAFEEFVQENLIALDELARRYAEYRLKLSQGYWEDLRSQIRVRKPIGYNFLDEKGALSVAGEKTCGWSCNLDFFGTQTIAVIGFGVNVTVADVAGGWPFLNNTCWTGIRVGLSTNSLKTLLETARRLAIDSEPVVRNWVLWRFWQPLCAATVEGLHEQLSGASRAAGQLEIVDQLEWWRQNFENLLIQSS
jgi:hypothetical protein